MARMQTPKGYYTATQVKAILKISSGRIAEYVEQGKIKHIIPPGRTVHGFYLKKDVDKLAHELQAFFELEEETETTIFTAATIEDIPACIALNRELFTASTSTDTTTLAEKWTRWLKKNPEMIYVLKREEEVIGIATVLPIKTDSEKFQQALRGDISFLLGDVNIAAEDIEEYKAGNHIQLYIAEIGIKQSFHKDLKRKYGAKLISNFMEAILDLGRRGVIIENIMSVGATRSGTRLLQRFGFSEVIFPRADTRLFTLNMKESGAYPAQAYREALKEAINNKKER
ncbi:MAG: hypothetical protein JO202_01420 [Ktedonobacteraceae bacterium]|nr:hypothetical protein [Ktedonobacteraceae bacterium]